MPPSPGVSRQETEAPTVDEIRIAVHVFLMVLLVGTLWRLGSYYFIASPQPQLQHLGLAMATQY